MTLYSAMNRIALELIRRKRDRIYLPNPAKVEIVVQNGAPQGAEYISEITPKDGYVFNIKYFRLTTPPEVEASVIIYNESGESVLMPSPLGENTSEHHDYSDYSDDFLRCNKVRVSAKTLSSTTDDRVVILEYSGNQEPF